MQRVPLMVEQQPSQEFRNAIDRFNRWVKRERERKYTRSSQRNDSASKRRNGRGKHVAGHREGHTCCNYVTRRTSSLYLSLSRRRESVPPPPLLQHGSSPLYSRSPRATTINTSSSPLGWCIVSFTNRAVSHSLSFVSKSDLIMAGRWKWPAARIYI